MPAVIWVLSFTLQLAAVPVAILASSAVTGKFLVEATLPYAFLDFWVKVTQTLLPDLIGFLFGYVLKPFPAEIREPGRWIWVAPAILFPILLGTAFFIDLHQYYMAVFGIRGADYDGLGVIGLIFPAGGICLYSIGIRAGDRYTHPLANVYEDEDLIPEGDPRRKAKRRVDPDTADPDTDVPRPEQEL